MKQKTAVDSEVQYYHKDVPRHLIVNEGIESKTLNFVTYMCTSRSIDVEEAGDGMKWGGLQTGSV